MGRPAGASRLADPPGLPAHADRAIALVRDADRMGFRLPTAIAMVDLLLGGRPEMKLLIMDQVFPIEPFQPESSSGKIDLPADERGPNP